jgi:hypothetical protein
MIYESLKSEAPEWQDAQSIQIPFEKGAENMFHSSA